MSAGTEILSEILSQSQFQGQEEGPEYKEIEKGAEGLDCVRVFHLGQTEAPMEKDLCTGDKLRN